MRFNQADLMWYVVSMVAYVVLCKTFYNVMLSADDESISDLMVAKTAVLALAAFAGGKIAVDTYLQQRLPFEGGGRPPPGGGPPSSAGGGGSPLGSPVRGPVGRQLMTLVPSKST